MAETEATLDADMTKVLIIYVPNIPHDYAPTSFLVETNEEGLSHLRAIHSMDAETASEYEVDGSWDYVMHRLGIDRCYSSEAEFEREKRLQHPPGWVGLEWAQYRAWANAVDSQDLPPGIEKYIILREGSQ